MKKCPICDGEMSIFDEAMILKKYKVNYWECRECGFIQTDNPYWLNEAYSSAIVDADIGLANPSIGPKLDACINNFSDALVIPT